MRKGALILLLTAASVSGGVSSSAQTSVTRDGFTHLESGLEYKILKNGDGKRHPQVGDHLDMNVRVHVRDSVIFDSRQLNNNRPVPFQVQPPSFKGDFIEGLMLMSSGDSAALRLPVDSIIRQGKQLMPGMKAGDMLEYDVSLMSVLSDTDYKKDQAEKAGLQNAIDMAILQEYFKKNHITAQSTKNGLYYKITKPGKGKNAKAGDIVSVNYTGKFMDGNAFDSNTDSSFKHPEPYQFTLGKGAVIHGWDEGIELLNKGAKATLYVPSRMAYGMQGNSNIPPNAILIFDVELVNVTNQGDIDEKLIKNYIAKNKIKAKKTPSGLYYAVTKEGKGATPAKGNKVSVNYTGMLLDGKKFDTNTDTTFHHMQPLEFPIGQGSVIKGWDEGISLLKAGSKAKLLIPSNLGYGTRGQQGAGISPNTVLLFDVELLDIKK